MKHKTFSFLLAVLMSMVAISMTLVSCSDDEGNGTYNPLLENPPLAGTESVYDITSAYALIEGFVDLIDVPDYKVDVYAELSTSQDFSSAKRIKVKELDEYGRFYVYALLEPSTKYYYRTHVSVTSASYGNLDRYGDIKSFTTGRSPIVVTGDAKDISASGAKIKGSADLALSEYGSMTATVGIEVSENSNFSKSKKLTTNTRKGEFAIDFTQLTSGILYYYRAFVELKTSANQKVVYGETKTFSTYNMYIDLGLPSGTLWATMNVGASEPRDGGRMFAWGETSGKSSFNWSTYKYGNGGIYLNTLTKYITNSKYGTVDNKTELELMDDAAYVNWGPDWRTPSSKQWEELINSNYTIISEVNVKNPYYPEFLDASDISLWKITSKKNGNFIYLNPVWEPEYDLRDTKIDFGFSIGSALYWTRTLDDDYDGEGKICYICNSRKVVTDLERCYGLPIRPVRAQ